ncbi:MAG: hypothetical protein AAFX54_01920 [Pseudomonadota bacterium]
MLKLITMAIAAAAAAAGTDLSHFNTPMPEYGLVEGPNGAYLTRRDGAWDESTRSRIIVYGDVGAPRAPVFASADANEAHFFFDAKGRVGYFTSDRANRGDMDIWTVPWRDNRWREPSRLPAPINSPHAEYSPVIGPDGALYFASARPGGAGHGDIYTARRTADFWSVERLSDAINSEHGEWNVGFSPDGAVMFVEASERDANMSASGDIYASRHTKAGWAAAVPLSRLNTSGSELMVRALNGGVMVYASSSDVDVDLVAAATEDLEFIAPSLAAVSRSSGSVRLLDPSTLAERAQIPVGEGPHDIASSEDGRTAIVPLLGRFPAPHENPILPSQLRWVSRPSAGFTTVDLVTEEHKTFPMENCREPHGAAITAQGRRAWITCEDVGEIREVDPQTGETLNSFKTAKGVHKVMLLAGKRMLAASNPDAGEAYLISLANGDTSTFETGAGAEGLAASLDETTLWVAQNAVGTVCAINVDTKTQTGCHSTGGNFPIALAVDEVAKTLWVLHNASSDLSAMSLDTGEITNKVSLPSPPLGMAFNATARRLYVTMPRRNEVIVIDADTLQILETASNIMEGDDLDLIPSTQFRSPPDT